jgi:hypothetical protein
MERMLTVTGRSDNIKKGFKLTLDAVAENGESGGRRSQREQREQEELEAARVAAGGSRVRGSKDQPTEPCSYPSRGLQDAGLDEATASASSHRKALGPMQPSTPPPQRLLPGAQAARATPSIAAHRMDNSGPLLQLEGHQARA